MPKEGIKFLITSLDLGVLLLVVVELQHHHRPDRGLQKLRLCATPANSREPPRGAQVLWNLLVAFAGWRQRSGCAWLRASRPNT